MTTVLVTRPAGEGDELVARLAAGGLETIHVPTIRIVPASGGGLRRALANLEGVAWLVVTSANGARAVVEALAGRPLPPGVRVAAIGPATADAVRRGGLAVSAVPGRYLSVEIASALGDVSGARIMLARADLATPALRDALQAAGAGVEEVTAYRIVEAPEESREPLRLALREGLDGILFTSGSTVRGMVALLSEELRQLARGLASLCIGPVSAQAARDAGFRVVAVAEEHTAAGLARATLEHFVPQEVT